MQDTITIVFSKDEALVVFELLSEFRDQPTLAVRDDGERAALWNLGAILEENLSEPFLPEYQSILNEAKRRLAEQCGLSTNIEMG